MRRILIVDDTPAIHEDFRKVLGTRRSQDTFADLERSLFGPQSSPPSSARAAAPFEVDSAMQGQQAVEMVGRKLRIGQPYALAFVDMRMPPGWDGVETTARMLREDPDLEVVICSAYLDYSWHDVIRRVNRPSLRLLRKPFETREVLDLAWSLTNKRLRSRGGGGPSSRLPGQ